MSRTHDTILHLFPANALTALRCPYRENGPPPRCACSGAWLKNAAQAEYLYGCDDRRQYYAQQFYDLMSRLDFLPNSPTLMNAGRDLQQLSGSRILTIRSSRFSKPSNTRPLSIAREAAPDFLSAHLARRNDMVASTNGIASGPVSFHARL